MKEWEKITGEYKLDGIFSSGEISEKNRKKLEQARVVFEKDIQKNRY